MRLRYGYVGMATGHVSSTFGGYQIALLPADGEKSIIFNNQPRINGGKFWGCIERIMEMYKRDNNQ